MMKSTSLIAFIGLALTVTSARHATAQTSLVVQPGTRIRVMLVTPQHHAVIGEFVDAGKSDLTLRIDGKHVEQIPFENIASLQRSVDRSRHPAESAVGGPFIGAIIGMLTGPKAAHVTVPGRDPSGCPLQVDLAPTCAYSTRARFSGIGAARGAVIGTGAGAIIGALLKSDTWSSILLDDLPHRVSLLTPGADDRRLGLSISFR